MAQTIKAITPKQKISVGGRFLVTAEITLGTEYLKGGLVFSEANLKECGLPNATVYSGYVNPLGKSELTGIYSIVITALDTEAQEVKLQSYVLGTATAGKPFKEQADKNGELSEQKLLVTFVGR